MTVGRRDAGVSFTHGESAGNIILSGRLSVIIGGLNDIGGINTSSLCIYTIGHSTTTQLVQTQGSPAVGFQLQLMQGELAIGPSRSRRVDMPVSDDHPHMHLLRLSFIKVPCIDGRMMQLTRAASSPHQITQNS